MTLILNRDAILAADDLKRESVEIPEWGGTVWVRVMTGAERDDWERQILDSRGLDNKTNLSNARARLAVLCACGENGERLFGDEDLDAVGGKSAAALERIFDLALKLNRIGFGRNFLARRIRLPIMNNNVAVTLHASVPSRFDHNGARVFRDKDRTD